MLARGEQGQLNEAIMQDGSCLNSSLWLYSQPDRKGLMACVAGQATVDSCTAAAVQVHLDN